MKKRPEFFWFVQVFARQQYPVSFAAGI